MKIIMQNTECGRNIFLENNGKTLSFIYRDKGTGDLYWTISTRKKNEKLDFVITKEIYVVYKLFEKLYSDIENINLFENIEIPYENKDKYTLYNYAHYNELFDRENKTITWYSDETNHVVSNILKIKKEEDSFKVEISNQPYIDGYEKRVHHRR